MRLSVCMITLNEEKKIQGCFDSLHEIRSSCEIIVVDTGSTDSTIKIVKDNRANVHQQKWEDNFAKPRNFALSLAIGNWILCIDADEILTKETLPELEKIILSEPGSKIYTVKIESRIKNRTVKKKILHNTRGARLYPNNKNLRYVLRVHEQLFTGKETYQIEDTDIQIIHSGYDVGITELRKKATRNISMLKLDEEIYDAGQIYYELAQSYGLLGNYKLSADYFKKAQRFRDLPADVEEATLEFLSVLAPKFQIKKPTKTFKKR